MAAQIKRSFGVDATLTPGNRGEFTVWRDGQKLVDKAATGKFPTDEEVVAATQVP